MDSSLHTFLAAQYIQDRMDDATSARRVREFKRSQPRQPRLRWLRRWLRRRAVAEAVPSATIAPLPPS